MSFPINQVNERVLAPGWSGQVFVCDIDRTYLYTRFSSLKGISRIPIEFAIDKMDIEGMAALLKEVRRGPERVSRHTPLYFISASPAQLRPVIERKMLLDGLEFDGTIFKDWWGVLASGRLKRFKEQLGFKLTGLLTLHQQLPGSATELLMGDDLESDPLAFALYADILAGRVPLEGLPRLLTGLGVGRQDAWGIADLKRMLPDVDGVQRAFIRLERNEPEALHAFFPGVLPCRDAFQMALAMHADGMLSTAGVARVGRGVADRGASAVDLAARLTEAVRHGYLPPDRARELGPLLEQADLLDPAPPIPAPDTLWGTRLAASRAWTPDTIRG